MNKHKLQNSEIIKAAIELLQDSNKKVTVKDVAELTNIYPILLYKHELMTPYIRHHKKTSQGAVTIIKPFKPFQQEEIESILEVYITHIKDIYFIRPETVAEVRTDMEMNTSNFRIDLFHQAINKLQADHWLKVSALQPGALIGSLDRPKKSHADTAIAQPVTKTNILNFTLNVKTAQVTQAEPADTKFVLLDTQTNAVYQIADEASLNSKINELLKDTSKVLKIFQACEVVNIKYEVVRTRV